MFGSIGVQEVLILFVWVVIIAAIVMAVWLAIDRMRMHRD
jgi:hypothetical protein